MSLEPLIECLEAKDWESQSPVALESIVAQARRELEAHDPGDPRVARLLALETGSSQAFSQLAADWNALTHEAELNSLKTDYNRLAADLSEEKWVTVLYERIHDAILDYKEGARDSVQTTIVEVRALLSTTWEEYSAVLGTIEGGLTAGAELGQRMLEEAYTLFHGALDEAEDAAAGHGSFGQALRYAEIGSRRLIATSVLNRRMLPPDIAPPEELQ